jgi:glutamate---cysteine ligase / carboxylate-amine ligase
MKDFYWDIRPKPEYGTIELRICDTPLTTSKAADLAAYLQMLVHYLLAERPEIHRDTYLTYFVNRYRATRYGFEGILIDPINLSYKPLAQDIADTCEKLIEHSKELSCDEALVNIKDAARSGTNGARLLRERYLKQGDLSEVVRLQIDNWNNIKKI